MHARACVRAAAAMGFAVTGYMGSSDLTSGVLGVSPAAAGQFYTRKRVNGQWITGMFPKGDGGGTRSSARRGGRQHLAHAPEADAVVDVLPPAREADVSMTASLAEPVLPAEPVSMAERTATIATSFTDATDERLARLRDALVARAGEIAAAVPSFPVLGSASTSSDGSSIVTSSPGAVQPVALESPPSAPVAPSRIPATPQSRPALPAATPAASVTPAPLAPLEPKSVSYDFERGIKTTVFESSVVREPFDVAALKGLGSRLPK